MRENAPARIARLCAEARTGATSIRPVNLRTATGERASLAAENRSGRAPWRALRWTNGHRLVYLSSTAGGLLARSDLLRGDVGAAYESFIRETDRM